MIVKITLENFFSFGKKTEIPLNPDINVLVGINGSGKSNLLKAIRLLYEGIAGKGFEKLFLRDWSGFDAVANFNGSQKDEIKLQFELDAKLINRAHNNRMNFTNNLIYSITIYRSGATSYYLEEILSQPASDTILINMKNTTGEILKWGGMGSEVPPKFSTYTLEKNTNPYTSSELIFRQISREFPIQFQIKFALEKLIIYEYFDTSLKSKIRQPSTYDTETRLIPNGQNLMSIFLKMKTIMP